MNPEIDLKSFRKESARPTVDERLLVSPPRRIVTRFVLPLVLFGTFAGIFIYAARDAVTPVTEVEVIQPVMVTGTSAISKETADSRGGEVSAPSQPLFQAPGWVEPDPFTTLVSSLVAGTLSEVLVREGQAVPAGAVVARLDATDAELGLHKTEANLAVRKAELEAAQENWDNPILLQQTLITARAEKARLEAEKIKVERQYEFQEKLAGISRQLGKTGADSLLAAEKATLEASVAAATVKEIDAKILAQDATLDSATSTAELRLEDKSRLALARAQMQEAEAAQEESRVALMRCEVTAPTTGTVMRLHKTPGAMVSADVPEGTQILSMYDPNSLQVRAEVPLGEAGKIQIGLPAEIQVEAMQGKIFKGELTRIVHQADVQRNSLQVKVRILNPELTLKPEMVAKVQFLSAVKNTAKNKVTPMDDQDKSPQERETSTGNSSAPVLLIPQSALPANAKEEAMLWLALPDGRAHQQKVRLGGQQGELWEVTQGLQPTDKVIISGADKLKEGRQVKINQNASKTVRNSK